jgi:diaminohydroxyphosphoribosylaminopyrimidine deaminase/5-amino-6-(5-phosphoribosylamino)uracil reductase
MMVADDIRHMHHAIGLASRGVGRIGRVPSVGCIVVSPDGHVIARGRTDESGRPHAEAVALAAAGEAARGATVYVTLEPCSHVGRSGGPCADLLIAADVARVVIACVDPDPRVNGQGISRLKAAGIAVDVGVEEGLARATLEGFFSHVQRGRPFVTLKIAQSLDSKTATSSGDSKWITGPEARRFGHLLRARHDAILVGAGTALADDPNLTCRITGLESYSPLRVVLDSKLRLSESSNLARTAHVIPTVVFTTAASDCARLAAQDVQIVRVAHDSRGRPDLGAMLTELSKRNVTRLLVEGGATVHAAFLDLGLADALEIFTAPTVLGGDGHDGIAPLAAATIGDASRFTLESVRKIGSDLLESYRARA